MIQTDHGRYEPQNGVWKSRGAARKSLILRLWKEPALCVRKLSIFGILPQRFIRSDSIGLAVEVLRGGRNPRRMNALVIAIYQMDGCSGIRHRLMSRCEQRSVGCGVSIPMVNSKRLIFRRAAGPVCLQNDVLTNPQRTPPDFLAPPLRC